MTRALGFSKQFLMFGIVGLAFSSTAAPVLLLKRARKAMLKRGAR